MSRSLLALSVSMCMLQTAMTSTAVADNAGSRASQKTNSSQMNTQPTFERGSCFDQGYQPDIRIWGDAEYLFWWAKEARVNVPLVTTGSLADSVPAATGQPNTKVLFGNESIDNDGQSGFRLALRHWCCSDRMFGIETSGFYLPKVEQHFSRSVKDNGFSILGVPFKNVSPLPLPAGSGGWATVNSGNTALLAADGTTRFGKISTTSSSQLWGLQLNGLFNFLSYQTFKLSAVGGAVYLDLQDSLNLRFKSQEIGSGAAVFREVEITDKFRTHNEFYGAQLGLKGEWSQDWLFVNFETKLGIGNMHKVLHIKGEFADSSPDIYNNWGSGSGTGIFAQPTNTGEHSRNRFAVAPQVLVRFGLNLCEYIRLSVGYDFLYICNVIRPGEQIDTGINETQAGPASNGNRPVLTGHKRPKVLHKATDYWTQGINAGVEYRF